jgi:hypothetical protein
VFAHVTEAEIPLLVTLLLTGMVGGGGVVIGWFLRGFSPARRSLRGRESQG